MTGIKYHLKYGVFPETSACVDRRKKVLAALFSQELRMLKEKNCPLIGFDLRMRRLRKIRACYQPRTEHVQCPYF
jgi:hypothetical protein